MGRTDDYISREAAKTILHDLAMESALNNAGYQCDAGVVFQDCAQRLKVWLAEVPAADVRPVVSGKWIKYAPHNSDMMTCSECEKYWILDGDQYEFNFCPNCGAEMRPETGEVNNG